MIRSITKALHQKSFLLNTKLSSSSLPINFHSNLLFSQSTQKDNSAFVQNSLANSYTRCFTSKTMRTALKMPQKEAEDSQISQRIDDSPHKFVKVTHEKSEHNAQNFFMKCMELLPESVIPDLIKRIDYFRSKVIAKGGKLESREEKYFLIACEKMFQKHNAEELMGYLVKIKPLDLKTTMLNSTIFGFDSEIDIKNKIDKFHSFSATTAPESQYSSDEAEHNLGGIQKEKTDSDVLAKTLKINFAHHDVRKAQGTSKLHKFNLSENDAKRLAEGLKGIEGVEIVNDFAGLEEISNIGGFDSNIQGQPIMNDIEELGAENEDFLEFMPEKGSASQAEIEVSRAINAASDTLFTDQIGSRRKDFLKHQLTTGLENIMQFQTQGKEEVVYVTQKGFDKKKIVKTNWVYLYGLPYEIVDEAAMKQEIAKHFESSVGKIKNIKLFSYKNFLDITETERKVVIHPNLEAVFDPISSFNEQFGFESVDYHDDNFDSHLVPRSEGTKNQLSEKEKDKVNSKLRVTKRILSSIKTKRDHKLEKSYALIELEDAQAKQRALVPDLRIFGMYIDKRLCMLEDADHKLSINCYNVHWGSSLKNFVSFVNQVFEDNNLLDLQIEIPEKFENRILTKFYVILRFNSFFNTLRAMQALENTIFEKRPLKIHHLYGSLKLSRGESTEIIDADGVAAKTVKVNETKQKETHKISLISKEDEELIDPLSKIEKEIQAFAVESQETEQETLEEICAIQKIEERREEKWYQSSESDSDEEDEKSEEYSVERVFTKGS